VATTGTTPAPRSAAVPTTLHGTGFGRLWLSTGTANLGDGLLLAGLPVLATTLTDSPAAIAGVTVALMLPMVVSALPAGAVADRADRRRILVIGNAGRAAALLGLLALGILIDLRLALVYAVAVVATSSEVLVDTTAQAAVPSLVPDARLDGANARLMVTQVVGNDAVGAPIGALLATVGGAALFGPSALLYLAAAVAATRLRLPDRAHELGSHHDLRVAAQVRSEVVAGLRHLMGEPVLRRLALANALSNLGNTAFAAIFVVFVVVALELPAAAYGLFLIAVAAGGLAGGVVAERVLRRTGSEAGIRGGFAVAVLCHAAVALARDPIVVGIIAAVLGAASMVINVAARTLRQRLAPDPMLGRVTASMAAVALVATPIGAVFGGAVAQWLGVAAVGWFAAATNLVALLLLSRVGC
jgi:MFS family permease